MLDADHLHPAPQGGTTATRVRAALKEEFGYKNDMQIPRLDKIVLNMGVGEAVRTPRRSSRPPRT